MDIQKLKELIAKFYSQREIAVELKCSQTTIKYWLKQYGLKTINTKKYEHIKVKKNEKYCSQCKKIKLKKEFYKHHSGSDLLQSSCKECNHKRVGIRAKIIKLKMLEYKGNKCVDCKLNIKNSHACVFDFHHINPKEKDINFKVIRWKKWDEIKKELDKCIILCANCHRIRHADI